MMTTLEQQLSKDSRYAAQILDRLLQEQGRCKRQLMQGGEPALYQQWQQEAEAIDAAITIVNRLTGE